MSAVFLSASVPVPNRGVFHEDANPFLIQFAVREFLTVVLGRRHLIWGGHPAITPMVWSVCEDLGVAYADNVTLYQSEFFDEVFPEENKYFANVTYTSAVPGDQNASVQRMRDEMLENDFSAAVFIGGMEGVLREHEMFCQRHPGAAVLAVASPGGAARQIAGRDSNDLDRIDFMRLFCDGLRISPLDPRPGAVRARPSFRPW